MSDRRDHIQPRQHDRRDLGLKTLTRTEPRIAVVPDGLHPTVYTSTAAVANVRAWLETDPERPACCPVTLRNHIIQVTDHSALDLACTQGDGPGVVELSCEISAATDEDLGRGLERVLRGISSYAASLEAVMEVEARRISGVRRCDPILLEKVRLVIAELDIEARESVLNVVAPAADIWVCGTVGDALRECGWEIADTL